MPHCILEYSSNVIDEPDWTATVLAVHNALIATGQFVLDDIKSRIVRHDRYVVGNGKGNQAFVALQIQILSGRDDEVKGAISEEALRILLSAFPRTLAELQASITVQISDIHRASYRRRVTNEGYRQCSIGSDPIPNAGE